MKIVKILITSVSGLSLLAGCSGRAVLPVVAVGPTTMPASARPIYIAEAPSTQPADDAQPLPAGHPDLSTLRKKKPSGELPAGHPDLSTIKRGATPGALPSGHPDLNSLPQPGAATQPAMPGMPAGHPDMSAIKGGAVPTTQAGMLGTLKVKVTQGTKDGPALAPMPVSVEMVLPDKTALDKFDAGVGKDGILVVEGLPTSKAFSPLIKVKYKGGLYEVMGTPFDAEHLTQELELKVYETQSEEPAWVVKMQHVMVDPLDAGRLQVAEMLAIENPADKAWLGKGEAADRVTLNIPLPAEAGDVTLVSGFPADSTTVDGGRIVMKSPLVPGVAQYRFAYTLPVKDGHAHVDFVAPGKVMNMIVFLPDDGTQVVAEGIKPQGTADMGNGSRKYFRTTDLAPGAPVKLTLSNVPSVSANPMPTDAPAMGTMEHQHSANAGGMTHVAKALAGTGALLILLFGSAFLLTKGPKAKPKKKAA